VNEAELLAWFDQLEKKCDAIPEGDFTYLLHPVQGTAWLGEVHSALRSTFPPGHPLLTDWMAIFERAKTYFQPMVGLVSQPYAKDHIAQARGVVQAAAALIRAGRLTRVLDGVRAETVSEVLDQAEIVLAAKQTVAAAVLAGGALETHLLHLCRRSGFAWTGEGSIAKYDQAVAQARNAGTVEVYPTTDSKVIGGWGGLRNDAAHHPTNFTRTVDDVRRMIEGIREFIARVP